MATTWKAAEEGGQFGEGVSGGVLVGEDRRISILRILSSFMVSTFFFRGYNHFFFFSSISRILIFI